MGKKGSINKERQIERGGRDGNGKKDEVIPVGAACVDLLNPSILLHLLFTSFFRHFFCRVRWWEERFKKWEKEDQMWRGKKWHQRWHQEEERSGVKQAAVVFMERNKSWCLWNLSNVKIWEAKTFRLKLKNTCHLINKLIHWFVVGMRFHGWYGSAEVSTKTSKSWRWFWTGALMNLYVFLVPAWVPLDHV